MELAGEQPRIMHRCAGIFGVTSDRLPLAGPVDGEDGLWVACGYSGHGNMLGLAYGELVAEAIFEQWRPELDLFDPRRLLG
jgi:sarcosine oxidase subunit beta